MSLLFKKESISSAFCDFYSEFNTTKILGMRGFRWPDDFEKEDKVGSSRFQVIRDFKSGACLLNHEGNLHPYTERKILERKYRVKEASVRKIFGDRTPFRADNVYVLETGFNLGNVEFMTLDMKKKETSFESYRDVVYRFPLFWLLNEAVALEETRNSKGLSSEAVQKLENDRIFKHKTLEGWQFMERDVLPSADEYIEEVEQPLRNYYFSRNDQAHVWLKFEFFSA